MACNTLSLATSSVAGVTAYAPLSSASSPFVVSSAPSMLAPLSCSSPLKSLSVSCSLSEKDAPASISMGKALLTGLVAAGAALSVFTADTASPPAAFAASGPGNNVVEGTAKKAQDLLKSADKLNIEDAPQRFGPGRVTSGGNQDSGKAAQDAGGKALSQIQNGISSIGDTFSGKSIGDTFSGKKGDVESAAKNVGDTFSGKSIENTLSGKKGDVESAAKNVTSQAQGKVDEATGNSGPGGLFSSLNSSIKGTVEGIKDSVSQKDGDAKRTLDEASSTVQNKLQ